MIRILPDAAEEGRFLLYDGETVCGSAEAVFGDRVQILSAEAPDELLAEGLVRAVLNAGRLREIPTAFCVNEVLFPLLRRLEFTPGQEGLEVDIAEFFFRGCHHS